MTAPAWLPTYPSTWADFEAAYRRVVPSEWPRNLFSWGSDAIKDLQAQGEALAQVRKLIEWVLRRVWPSEDSDGLFLGRWEESLGISAAQSITWRKWWIRSILGLQAGTLYYDKMRAILAGAFGSSDHHAVDTDCPTSVYIASVGPDTAEQWAFCSTNVHWFSFSETVAPDDRLAQWILSLVTPAGALWSYGEKNHAVYSAVLSADGSKGYTYNHSTYRE